MIDKFLDLLWFLAIWWVVFMVVGMSIVLWFFGQEVFRKKSKKNEKGIPRGV